MSKKLRSSMFYVMGGMDNKLIFILILISIGSAAQLGVASSFMAVPNALTVSNTIMDLGHISVANTVISGGIGPYNGNGPGFPRPIP